MPGHIIRNRRVLDQERPLREEAKYLFLYLLNLDTLEGAGIIWLGRRNPFIKSGWHQPILVRLPHSNGEACHGCRLLGSAREAAIYVQASRLKIAAPFSLDSGFELPVTMRFLTVAVSFSG
jgi:hypothetical protein